MLFHLILERKSVGKVLVAANYLDLALVFTPSIISELFNLVLDLFVSISDSYKGYYWLSFLFYMWIEGAGKSLFFWGVGAATGLVIGAFGVGKFFFCLLLLL